MSPSPSILSQHIGKFRDKATAISEGAHQGRKHMEVKRRSVVAGGAAALLAGGVAEAKVQETENPLAASFPPDGNSVKVVEIKTDADGHAVISPVDLPADKSPYPLFKQFLTHKASAVAVYSVPPNHHIPTSFDPVRRFVFIVSGETTLIAKDATHKCEAGSIILLDGKSDLAARSGPVGYVAIKVQVAD
jgi:hypothetical protein